MSILLEALRKSEKDQNPPEAADIHADDDSGRYTESIQIGPLAILLVLTLFASGWFVWNQYQAPPGHYQPPVTLASGQVNATATPVSKPVAMPDQTTEAPKSGAAVSHSEGRPRTPVESYQDAIKNISKATPATTNQAAVEKQKPVVARPTEASKSQPATASVTEEPRHHEPAPISYWELPDSIRADLLELKFSVLVYAKQPEDRFVLINGQRLAEGDSAQPGLVVKEIRRDGVIFSYRLYQFLVER